MSKPFLKNTTLSLLILGLLFSTTIPEIIRAEGVTGVGSSAVTNTSTGGGYSAESGGDAQANAYLTGAEDTGQNSEGVKNIAVDLLGCSAGQLLAQVITMGFNTLVTSLLGNVENAVLRIVPVAETGEQAKDIKAQTSGHTIQQHFGVPFGSSFDAMGWCIVNSIITYVADATVAWANNGFNGQPAFLQNPDRFFETLADKEASKFIGDLAYNTTGINLCQPFRVEVSLGLSNAYGNNMYGGAGGMGGFGAGYGPYAQKASCTIDQMASNISNFGSDNINIGGRPSSGVANGRLNNYWTAWNSVRQDRNNVFGSYMLATDYLNARIAGQQNTAKFELSLNKGWLNFKKCENPEDQKSCNTYTPGTLIESSLEKTLGLPKDRLVAVQKFDQVITAVVNNLIKVALHKILDNTNSSGE